MSQTNYITDRLQQALKAYLQSKSFANIPQNSIYAGIDRADPGGLLEHLGLRPPAGRALPCVVCLCESAEAEDVEHFFGNWDCEAQVQIMMNFHDTHNDTQHETVTEILDVLSHQGLATDLSAAVDDFTARKVFIKAQSWTVEGAKWIAILTLRVLCCGSDIS